jgi:1,4-dihydroxy-2-naphthoate octaprenyltransferase
MYILSNEMSVFGLFIDITNHLNHHLMLLLILLILLLLLLYVQLRRRFRTKSSRRRRRSESRSTVSAALAVTLLDAGRQEDRIALFKSYA